MLCLTFHLGDRAEIETPDGQKMIVSYERKLNGSKIRLGFNGPREIQVTREKAKNKTQKSAAGVKE